MLTCDLNVLLHIETKYRHLSLSRSLVMPMARPQKLLCKFPRQEVSTHIHKLNNKLYTLVGVLN
jgi:hypothetical protein